MKYRSSFLVWLTLASIITGCKKFVLVDPPQTRLVTASVFADNATANSAVTVIYSQMINQSTSTYYIPLITGLSSDELTNYSTQQSLVPFYTNSLTPLNGLISNLWSPAYNYIYQANSVLSGLQKSDGVSEAVKKQLTGEALFIRAFWHFYLVNLFGDIPVVTSTDYSINSVLFRLPKTQVYQQIISDLKNAQVLLNSHFVDASDTTITLERTRPTKWAATALLARAYLYSGDWLNAELQSSSVINNSSLFTIVSPLEFVFLKNSSEAIWQIQPVIENANTPEGINFILAGPPAANVFNCATISSQLLDAFEPSDNRKTAWVGNFNSYYFPNKYKAGGASTTTSEYSMVLRLAEMYLIRAEARAQGIGIGLSGAITDLNIIRNRAGLPNYFGNTDKPSLLAAILHERQVELFTEWGHRWLDIKRTMNVDGIMSIATPLKGGIWNTNEQLYPIPQLERENDPNLSQNTGY